MTTQGPHKRLPENPSEENLRKQAKQLAKNEGLQLAVAQRRLATEYGYRNWGELIRAVVSRFVPVIPLRELVVFPLEVYPIYIGRPRSVSAIDAVAAGAPILLIAQRDAAVAEPSPSDMYEIGTLGVIVERQNLPDGSARIVVEGRRRARAKRFVFDEQSYKADVEEVPDTERLTLDTLKIGLIRPDPNERARTLVRSVQAGLEALIRLKRKMVLVRKVDDPALLPYAIARDLNFAFAEQQALLECVNPIERLETIVSHLD